METGAVYSDFSSLAALRSDAKANPNAALEDVAAQFESLFIQNMLKSMRDATVQGDLFNSSQMDTYTSMADQQIALTMAENGGIGIARFMVEQMQTRHMVPGQTAEGELSMGSVSQITNPAEKLHFTPRNTEAAIKAFELNAANPVSSAEES